MFREPFTLKFVSGIFAGESASTKFVGCDEPEGVQVRMIFIFVRSGVSVARRKLGLISGALPRRRYDHYASASVNSALAAPLLQVRLLENSTASKRCLLVEYMKPACFGPALL